MERDIQLAHLRAFEAVARLGSFTRAAAELGYTEPAVHLQVGSLRKAVGGPVVEYRRGRMELTPLGETLLPFAASTISGITQLLAAAKQHATHERQTLRVGVGRGTGDYVFPRLASAFRRRYPEVCLEFHSLPGDAIVRGLADSTIDAGFGGRLKQYLAEGEVPARAFAVAPWFHLQQLLLGSPGFAARARQSRGVLPVAIPAYASITDFEDKLVNSLRDTGFTPQFQVLDTTEAAKAMALAGEAAACLGVYSVGLELEVKRLVPILPEHRMPNSPIYVLHRRPATNPGVRTFIDFLRQERRAGKGWDKLLAWPGVA